MWYTEHTAVVSGRTTKDVRCERCGCEYSYRMTRSARGTSNTPLSLYAEGGAELAERRARKHVARFLARECEAVPCPDCGWFQAEMVKLLRHRRYAWLLWTSVFLPMGILVVVGWYGSVHEVTASRHPLEFWTALGTPVVLVSALSAVRYRLMSRWDPNVVPPTLPAKNPRAFRSFNR